MSVLDCSEPFIGKIVRDVRNLFWIPTGETRNKENWLHAVALDFGNKVLVFCSEADDGTISAHSSASVQQWIDDQGSEFKDEVSNLPNDHLKEVVGERLCYVWECQNTKGFIDAVDLAIGDLVFPTVKIFSAGATLCLFSMKKLRYVDP